MNTGSLAWSFRLLPAVAAGLLLTACAGTPEAATVRPADSGPADCVGYGCGPKPAMETSPSATATAEPTSRPAGLGDTVAFEAGGAAGTITLKAIRRIPEAQGMGQQYLPPPETGSYLVAHFKLRIEHGRTTANLLAFEAREPDGTVHHALRHVVLHPINGRPRTIEAGEAVVGDVAFDASAGGVLIYCSLAGSPLGTFEVHD